uniref:PR domain zinc finger protein 8 n=1 Tax=Macaca fascicularis TaxID=9541 RepID=A0A7N9D3A7_MACFA
MTLTHPHPPPPHHPSRDTHAVLGATGRHSHARALPRARLGPSRLAPSLVPPPRPLPRLQMAAPCARLAAPRRRPAAAGGRSLPLSCCSRDRGHFARRTGSSAGLDWGVSAAAEGPAVAALTGKEPHNPQEKPKRRQHQHLLTWKYTDTIGKKKHSIASSGFQVALFGRVYTDLIPVMEDTGIQRGIWDGDAKAVQQCLTDIFTSVYTTCDIPENAIFGPCVLSHTSLYDSIAFIALKSTDKRTVPYIFRVDTSAANGSSEGLMWLRLVQSARDKEEQNLEAYIKNGQLFYRSLRRIAKDEELLVWYGKELTELLLLCPSRSHNKMNGSSPYTCLECSQRFQFEFPYVAHLRFRCPKRLHSADISPQDEQGGGVGTKDHGGGGGGGGKDQQQQQEAPLGPGPKFCKAGPLHHYPTPSPESSNPPAAAGGSSAKPSTDFHNLARELENSRGGSSCSPAQSLSSGSGSGGGGGHQEAELSPDGIATGGGKGKRKFPEEAAEGGGGAGLVGSRGRFAERPLPASKEDLVCTPQQYRASGSYFGLEENGRLFAPPSPETGEAKRSAFVEVKKATRAAGLQEEGTADGGASPPRTRTLAAAAAPPHPQPRRR